MDPHAGTTQQPFTLSEHDHMRAQFPHLSEYVYFNTGFMGPTANRMVHAMHRVLADELANRGAPDWPTVIDERRAQVRAQLGSLLSADASTIALMHATHPGAGVMLAAQDWQAGDVVITTDQEHPSILSGLRMLTERFDIAIETVPFSAGAGLAAAIEQQLSSSTRMVILSHVSWMSGQTADIRSIADMLPDEVLLVVDGAQAAGALPVNVTELGCDAYTVSGQKWLCGPNTTGAIYVRDPERHIPPIAGWKSTTDPIQALTAPLNPTAERFEFAQESLALLAGFAESLKIIEHADPERMAAHSRWLNTLVTELLVEHTTLNETDLFGDYHLLFICPGDAEASAAVTASIAESHKVRVKTLGSTVRVSLGFFNNSDDAHTLVEALQAAL